MQDNVSGLLHLLSEGQSSILDCLMVLRERMRPLGVAECFYGYFPNLKARNRNDTIFVATGGPDLFTYFSEVGGTANDWVASRLESISKPMPLDLVALIAQAEGDIRSRFLNRIMESGIQTAWICPISLPDQLGFGVVNHFMPEENAPPPLEPSELIDLASRFHLIVKANGMLMTETGVSEKEGLTLRLIAQGQSAGDIALSEGTSRRAIEARLQSVRRKLRARTTAEAVFKATAYGILRNPQSQT